MKIPFNIPTIVGDEQNYIAKVIESKRFSGDGNYTKLCQEWFTNKLKAPKALLTSSCTHALELSALLIDLQPGDEVITSSFSFVSSANAFALRGAKIIFIDIDPITMNMDVSQIEQAITKKTKTIIPIHYAGVPCKMDEIMRIANEYKLWVIEDAAHGILAKYKNKYQGTIGHLGCFSFHETKNLNCGEGGALVINHEKFFELAEIIREKGTNRSKFLRGEIDKYSWVEIGSSYLLNELSAAFLYTQLLNSEKLTNKRLTLWNRYFENLKHIPSIKLPTIPDYATHNAHVFFIKTENMDKRDALIQFLKSKDIQSTFHYVPLHSSTAGKKYSEFRGIESHTTKESERLLRLPLYYELSLESVDKICDAIKQFYAS